MTSPSPFQGWFLSRGLELAIINLFTKFKLKSVISTSYKDIKCDTKCGKRVVWGSYESHKLSHNSAIRYSTYKFLLAIHSNYVTILHCFWDIARHWSKITDFNPPIHIWCPCRVWPHWNFTKIFGARKLVSVLLCGIVCVIAISVRLWHLWLTNIQHMTTAYSVLAWQ